MIAPKGEVQTTPRLSLFQIKTELLGLVEAREDAKERLAMAGGEPSNEIEIEKEIATLNGLIKQYIGKEVQKVDSCAVVVQEYAARCKARREAAAELNKQADADEETAKAVKGLLLEVMKEFGEKKLYGVVHTISRQGNGGVQALTIAQPDLVPDKYKRVTVTMSVEQWEKAMHWDELGILNGAVESDPFPDNQAIREALERGEGVMGARLEDRGEHIRIR